MSNKKKIVLLFLISLVFFGASLYLGNPYGRELCVPHDTKCNQMYAEAIAQPMFFFSLAVLLSLLLLLFMREQVFKAWLRFAYWAIPIGVILLWLAPTDTPGGIGISYFNYTKESASWLVSGLFLMISLVIIAHKTLRARGNPSR